MFHYWQVKVMQSVEVKLIWIGATVKVKQTSVFISKFDVLGQPRVITWLVFGLFRREKSIFVEKAQVWTH